MTERARSGRIAEEALAHSQRQYRELVEHSLGLICAHDLDGVLLFVNPAAAHSLGYEPGEGEGVSLRQFLAPGAREHFDDYLNRIRQNGVDVGLMRLVAKDGRERVWMYRNILYDEPPDPPRVLGHAVDITDRIQIERELRESQETLSRTKSELDARVLERTSDLQLANERLQAEIVERQRAEEALLEANARLADADRRKDEFIAILSHELRNPLAPIRYALPLLRRGELDETRIRAIAVVDRQVDHLTRLVDDLLDVSRITSGKIELHREYVTLRAVITSAVEAASPAIAAARHTLKLSTSDEPIWLYADPARAAQVVTNLLNNAAKYTPRGGHITLETTREGREAVVRVRDTGIGIPPGALPHLFEMFHQVNARADKSAGGLGVGLSIVKRLVEMHGGSVQVHSAGVEQGAEFVVRLPIAAEARGSEVRTETPVPGSGRRLKVLVVDDNADLVDMLALVITNLGHDVRKALDGRSALSAAAAYRPDVVLLDLGLPVMNGIEVARELRRSPDGAGMRLVALTGWGQPEDRRQTEEAGFDQHLTKPTDPKTLAALLARFAGGSG